MNQSINNTYNAGISFIRVIAMLSIILGHWCSWASIYTFQLLSIGVEVFLFISGYLYGNKEIVSFSAWGGQDGDV